MDDLKALVTCTLTRVDLYGTVGFWDVERSGSISREAEVCLHLRVKLTPQGTRSFSAVS